MKDEKGFGLSYSGCTGSQQVEEELTGNMMNQGLPEGSLYTGVGLCV